MFERFTKRARRVIELSQQRARTLNHDHIGTEHLLLGLIREDEGVAAQVLAKAGVDLDAARQHVVELVGRSEPDDTDVGPIGQKERRLRDEVKRLRALLRQHDIDPDDDNTA